MANIKISELPAASAALGTQEFEVNESGTSKKVTGTQIATYVRDEVTLGDLGITATATELNYTDGVTSNIQTQLDGKASTATTISAGAGLTGGGSLGANRTISHADTSSQASVNNSGSVYIQDITLDTYGHVTAITSTTVPASTPTTTQVLTATAGATAGAVGTYAFVRYMTVTDTDLAPNATVAGSALRRASVSIRDDSFINLPAGLSTAPSGTWRVMGFFGQDDGSETDTFGHSLVLRIS